MLRLSQGDPRWGFKTIGNSTTTLKDKGCCITAISMASDYFGCFKSPGWMAKNLTFLADKVIWKSIERDCCFKFKYRYYQYTKIEKVIFTEAIKNPKTVCLLEVNNKSHWVLATRRVPFGYWCADPYTGGNKFYSDSKICGGTILEKK